MKLNFTKTHKANDCLMVLRFLLLSLFLFFSSVQNIQATHAAGADLTYKCLGGLMYQVDATFYRDCGGSSEPGSITISYKSGTCGFTRSVLANKIVIDNGQEITLPCATSSSTCSGGITTGIRKWKYRAIITLPAACADWIFSYRICCRNCTVTTIQSPCAVNSEIYIEALLNNLAAPGNSSPEFNVMPVAFVCLGQNFNYNQGVYDIDGDSISYELITPKTSAIAEVTWAAPATTMAPMASSSPFTLNAVTGDINFTPSAIQIGILAIRVKEFRNGQLIGSTIRDMQVYAQNCSNSIPVATGINGTSNYLTTACAGQQTCFNIAALDADSIQTVTFSTYNPIQGSTLIQNPGINPSMQFCWTPSAADIRCQPYIFTVTIIDNACPINGVQTFSYTIFVSGPQASISTVDPDCGLNNGSATLNDLNGTGYTYLWNCIPAQFNPVALNLVAGNYQVSVTDQLGCTAVFDATLNAPPNTLNVSCSSSGTISCQTGNIGNAQVMAIGGNTPYTYLWNTGATSAVISGLGAGVYYATVTDAIGCSKIDSTTIASAAGNLTSTITVAYAVSCYGSSDGAVSVLVSGGLSPYSYLWSNNISTPVNNGVQAGNYSVLVIDASGCSITADIILNQPSAPITTTISNTNINCFGGNEGTIDLLVSGGTSPYNFAWSNGASIPVLHNLTAGNYEVVVTDANGCSAQQSTLITQPAAPLVAMTTLSSHVSCMGGTNGALQLTVNGGTAPYNYLWSNGITYQDLNAVSAGNYFVSITDANGCNATTSGIINEPAQSIAVELTAQHIVCYNDSNGSLNTLAVGGTGPFSYLWNTGAITPQIAGLIEGTYTVTVTDGNNCSAVVAAFITQPGAPLVSVITMVQSVTCFGQDNGAILLNVTGGTLPYTYLWSNGNSSEHPVNLPAGTFSYTVTDSKGCVTGNTGVVSGPLTWLLANVSVLQEVKCHGSSDGAIAAVTSGGTAPYTYLWNTGAQSAQLSELTAGVYTLNISDSNGCKIKTTTSLSQPSSTITLSGNVTNADCINGMQGKITLDISGGTPGYNCLWNNGSNSQNQDSLIPGNYSVTITDLNECTYFESYEVLGSTSFSLNASGATTICTGETVTLIADSIANASYQWYYDGTPLSGATNMQFITPAAGTYSVGASTNCGNFNSNSIDVVVKTIGNVSVSNTQIICPPETVQLNATGGVTYEWSPASYITMTTVPDPFVSPLVTSLYSVQITNEWGCKASLSTTVAAICDSLLVPTGFSPNSDGVNDGYVIDGIENYPGNKLWVYNRWGKLVYKASDYNNAWDGIGNISGISMGQKVPSGTYFFILDLNDQSKPKAGYLIIRH